MPAAIEQQPIVQQGSSAGVLRMYRLALLLVLLKPFGNLSLAWGMRHVPLALSIAPLNVIQQLFEPFVALGIGMHILWLVLRISLLSLADLSFVLPITASGYVLSAVLGRVFLNEHVTPARWLGILLLAVGVVIAGSTSRTTTKEA